MHKCVCREKKARANVVAGVQSSEGQLVSDISFVDGSSQRGKDLGHAAEKTEKTKRQRTFQCHEPHEA